MATTGSNGIPVVNDEQLLQQQRANEEFIPGDNIAQFYIYFGIALVAPYSIFLILSNEPSKLGWFAYHPPLLAIALSALAYAISPLQSVSRPDNIAAALDIHGLFAGFVALPLFLIGASLEWQHKENSGKEHLTSWHGTLGALGLTLLVFQGVMGFLLGGGYLPKKYNRYHRQSGYILLILLSLTVMMGGLFSNFVQKHAWTATRWIVFGLGPVSIAGGVLARARPHKLGL